MMGGSAFLDHDGDGDLDLYVLNGSQVSGFPDGGHPRNAFYRNDNTAFVEAAVEAGVGDADWGMGCAVADYDNDGDPDLYVTNYGGNSLYANRGDGTFADVSRTRRGRRGGTPLQHRVRVFRLRPGRGPRSLRRQLRRLLALHGKLPRR